MKMEGEMVRFDARDYFRLLKQRWLIFLFGAIGTAICVVALFTVVPISYTGHAVVRVETKDDLRTRAISQSSTSPRASSLNYLNTEAATIRSPRNIDTVVEQAEKTEEPAREPKIKARQRIARNLKVSPRPQTNLINIYYVSRDSEVAGRIANQIAKSYLSLKSEQIKKRAAEMVAASETDLIRQQEKVTTAKDTVDTMRLQQSEDLEEIAKRESAYQTQKSLLHAMEARFEGAHFLTIAGGKLGIASIHQESDNPAMANTPGVLALSIITTLLGLAGGLVVSLIPARITHGGEVIGRLERKLSLDLITFVKRGKIFLLEDPKECHADAEPYRGLRTRIQKMPLGPSRMIAMVASNENEGSSEAVVNTASVFADSGKTVLLIDADIQRPTLHHIFTASPHPGLSDYLRGEMRLEETVVKTHYPNLWFMPSGQECSDSCSLLAGKRMVDLIWEMKGRFDYVFINSPSIFGRSDAMVLTGYSDQTLLVADHHRSSVKTLKRAKKMVEMSGGNFSGLILNEASGRKPRSNTTPNLSSAGQI